MPVTLNASTSSGFIATSDTSGVLQLQTNGSSRLNVDASGRITMPNQPMFSVIGTGSGSKAAGSVFGFVDSGGSASLILNIGSCWSNANNRFTAPISAKYIFNFGIFYQNGSSIIAQIAPCVNGSQLSSGDTFIFCDGVTGSTDTQINGCFLLNLSANDFVDLRVRSGSSAITYYSGHSFFQGYLLGQTMSKTYTIILSDAEDKALHYVAASAEEWINNAVHERCRIAIEEIFVEEAKRIAASGGEISGTMEDVVLAANIESAKERNDRLIAEMEQCMGAK